MAKSSPSGNYSNPTFVWAQDSADSFTRTDISDLAQAVHQHDHSSGKGAIIDADSIKSSAVTTAKIANLAVTAGKLGSEAVQTGKIQDSAVTEAKLGANAVAAAKIKDGAVTEAKIYDGSVTENKLGAGAVTETKLGTGAVTVDKIGALAVNDTKLAANAVIEAKILNSAVTENKLATDAVTTVKIKNDAVTTAKILNANVTYAKLASDATSAFATAAHTHPAAATFTAGMIMGWNSTLASIPSGWTELTDARDKVIVGAGGSYAVNASSGSTTASFTHVHRVSDHTHVIDHSHATSAISPGQYGYADQTDIGDPDEVDIPPADHTHTVTGTTSGTNTASGSTISGGTAVYVGNPANAAASYAEVSTISIMQPYIAKVQMVKS